MHKILTDHPGRVTAVAFNADGTRLATASCAEAETESGCKGGEIRVWNMVTEQLDDDPLVGHTNVITALAWMPEDVATLISGSADKTLIAWDTAAGKQVRTFEGHSAAVNSVAVNPSGTQIASGANDTNVIIWDFASGTKLHSLGGHQGDVSSVAFSQDGRWLASGSDDGTAIIWDAEQGKEIRELKGHNGSVLSVAWSPDGKLILSGSMDGTAILWNAPSDAQTG
jgi:WD40 repeat protein